MAHTPTQKKALAALAQAGGSGVIDKAGRVVGAGEILGTSPCSPYSAATWLRLMTDGSLESDGPNRIKIVAPATTVLARVRSEPQP